MSEHAVHDGPVGDELFSAAEWRTFRMADKRAGGAIVVLMTSIFTFGLILYTVVLVTL